MDRVWPCILVFLMVMCAGAGSADTPLHGLMWNRTGLPAVFPLQVKTPQGQNYHVQLVDAASGAPALAAFVEGGRFFKVLVPPGDFEVHFASGRTWESETALFGAEETHKFRLTEPLTFAVVGASVKAGHIIDLTRMPTEIILADSIICQRFVVKSWPRTQAPFDDLESYATRLTGPGELAQFPNRYSRDRLSAGRDEPVVPTDFAPYYSDPTFDLRTTPC